MRWLELRFLPMAVMVVFAAVMLVWSLTGVGGMSLGGWRWGLALVVLLLALGFVLSGGWLFRRHQTTVNPRSLENTRTLVDSDVYALSRNPMYVGFSLSLLALAIALNNAVNVVWVPVYMLYLNRFQILPEERFLVTEFGDAYRDYCRRVRRWL